MISNCKIWFKGEKEIVKQAKIAEHFFKLKLKSMPKKEKVKKAIKATPMPMNPICTSSTHKPTPSKPVQMPLSTKPKSMPEKEKAKEVIKATQMPLNKISRNPVKRVIFF